MTLNQLRIVVAIVDAGFNITHAAERVHQTQPGLSKQLKQLEGYLGLTLFVRRGKSIKGLTEGGQSILEHARRVIGEVRQIRSLAANLRDARQGALRIATVHTPARYLLPPVLAELRAKLPEVSVDIEPAEEEEALQRLKLGQADVAIVSTCAAPPAGVDARPAYHWHRVAIVPRTHRLAALTRKLTLADLAPEPLISYRSSRCPDSSLRAAFSAAGLEPNVAFTARDADVIKAHVRAGLGVGLVASIAITPEDREQLVLFDVSHLFLRCTTWLALRQGEVVPRYVAEFLALVARHAPDQAQPEAAARAAPAPAKPRWRLNPAPISAAAHALG
jgi:DNA-binding transcriptional LysR family regulator